MILEELCINDNTATSPEIIDVEMIHDNDLKRTAVQVEKSSNTRDTIVTENTETNIASDAEARVEKADNDVDMTTNNDTNMKDIDQEEIQILQESIKMQPSSCIKKNPVKHSATTNAQDEIQAKRIRFQIENNNDNDNKIIASQPMDIVKEVNSKSSVSVPKIINIESVHYNIAPISTSVNHPNSPSINSNNMFSMRSLECCDSISSFDFMSKGCHIRRLFIFYCFSMTAKLDIYMYLPRKILHFIYALIIIKKLISFFIFIIL